MIQANVTQKINKAVATVFEAVVQPEQMTQYFISEASGPMETGKKINWKFGDVGAEVDVLVLEVKPQEQIKFRWPASGDSTLVEMNFKAVGAEVTEVSVTETGWEMTEQGVQQALQQTQGWTDMLLCLKAYLEFGINLRKGKK
ncbi:MAG: SRPBCC domain-containing protein [Hymenobacteraceae bacterium]|nr:SRPBCC domain-containing protein [Hymenobacteraceae bacterium]MDX5397666.1 SRPBCC domain-containing protein [Hymenobacteraceae bacterium]MDX5443096.1 SRPBCC domain-containing protein [Hymenobacteraceae bacterium]MDX5513742.1 SRPBCC domain-containing protein [Hymenobacteraceae bacterium]